MSNLIVRFLPGKAPYRIWDSIDAFDVAVDYGYNNSHENTDLLICLDDRDTLGVYELEKTGTPKEKLERFFRPVILTDAQNVILVSNTYADSAKVTSIDQLKISRLQEKCRKMGVNFLDYIILFQHDDLFDYFSFRDNHLLDRFVDGMKTVGYFNSEYWPDHEKYLKRPKTKRAYKLSKKNK